ncbi:MAG: cadherin-like beta sandwich domain-containing protein, partial [Nitrospira sp.]
MRTMTVVRQYLAAAFLLVIGLIAYGCGDSATVSEPATLGNLSASTGELQPPFAPGTTDYTVRLSSDVSSTTITASPRVAGDSIQFDNEQTTSRTITLASPGDEKPITIVVADTGAGGASKSYRVTVKRDKEDTSLSALSVSEGSLAPPLFDKNIRDYTVNNVSPSVTKVIISATKSNQNTVMQIDGPSGSVTVPAGDLSGQATVQLGGTGSDTKVSIVVTATGGSPNTYTVTINRGPSNDNFLKGLSIPPGKLDFKVTSFVYNVTVLSNVDNVTVTATPRDPTASITINGSNTNSQLINVPVPGAPPVQITIRVTAQNGESKNYTINVKRAALNGNNDLKSLSISPGKLNFEASDTLYDINVSNNVEKVTVTATPQVSTASVAILVNGVGTNSQPITLLGPGLTTKITVRVTAQNGTPKDYEINVKRAALGGNFNLKSLTVSPGNLAFDPDDLTYDVSLLSNVTSVKITAAPQDPNAKSVTINGQPSPNTINLGAPGPETRITIPIIVTAQNNETKKYEVTVIRAALGGNFNLKSLTVTSHT